jgi:hypothetical protein
MFPIRSGFLCQATAANRRSGSMLIALSFVPLLTESYVAQKRGSADWDSTLQKLVGFGRESLRSLVFGACLLNLHRNVLTPSALL